MGLVARVVQLLVVLMLFLLLLELGLKLLPRLLIHFLFLRLTLKLFLHFVLLELATSLAVRLGQVVGGLLNELSQIFDLEGMLVVVVQMLRHLQVLPVNIVGQLVCLIRQLPQALHFTALDLVQLGPHMVVHVVQLLCDLATLRIKIEHINY